MKTVVLLSGGLDSSVLLASLLADGDECRALSARYGQRHARELEAAAAVAGHYGVPHEVVDLPPSLLAGSALTGGPAVPHGHYADESMRATVVPNRNMLLLALGGAVAVREGCDAVAYAAHGGDHHIYEDCRSEFVCAMRDAMRLCSARRIDLLTPFVLDTKADIVALGAGLGVPFGLTWTCYDPQPLHCGKCGSCNERKAAFSEASVPDPTEYAA